MGSPAQDFKIKKDTDDEVKDFKPRSKGEEDFKNAHKTKKTGHPVATEIQFSGGTKSVGPHKGAEKAGEKQLTSFARFAALGGKIGSQYHGMSVPAGEKTTVMQGSSRIKEEIELDEEYQKQNKRYHADAIKQATRMLAVLKDLDPSYESKHTLRMVQDFTDNLENSLDYQVEREKREGMYEGTDLAEVTKGYINLGGSKVKDDEKSILQHIKKTFPNVNKVKKDPRHGWIPVFEEVDLAELSRKTLGRYVKGAARDRGAAGVEVGRPSRQYSRADSAEARMRKRQHGIETAADKLTREETELDEMFKAGTLKLRSGETVKVDETTASALNTAIDQLNGANKKKMETESMKDKSSFDRISKFAKSVA